MKNLQLVKRRSKLGGCFSADIVVQSLKTVCIRSSREFCKSSLHNLIVRLLSKLLWYVEINGRTLSFGFGIGAGP